MKVEFYQVLVPLLSLFFIAELVRRFRQSKMSPQEAFAGSLFWLLLAVLAVFPDFFSRKAAEIFGIKNNVNAVIFLSLGVMFFFQYKLFFMFKRQEQELTRLTRQIALREKEKKEDQ